MGQPSEVRQPDPEPQNDPFLEQRRIVEFCSGPGAFSAAQPERVDTHLSHLFLTDERVYKMKRAVHYPFVDFSTLEARRAACEAELACNHAARALYIRSLPVTEHEGQLFIDGPGAPVEWLVEMARFAEADQFDRMAADDRLTMRNIRDLGRAIAEAHKTAPRVPLPNAAERVLEIVRQVRDTLSTSLMEPEVLDLVSRWAEKIQSAHGTIASHLAARGRHGLVRRCHGDMHLGNICLFEGKPTPFDAIEFSKEIATIDVIYDLAFPVMDLLAWDRPALANQLMNRYFEKTADYHATDLLPLFISLRAAIRAMTAALAAPNKPASESCRRYLGVALTALEPRPTPRLIAVGGLSGTGKTTFARLLAPHLCGPEGAVILRSDVIRKIHIGIEAELSAPQSAYEPSVTAFVYGRMMKMASKALRSGRTVILDAAFLSPPERQTCRRLAEQLGIQLTGFWLEAPHDVLEERIINRTDDASDATCSVLAKQEEYDCGSIDWINLNTRDGCMAHVETALQAVGLSSE